jgi:hypothetical protein
MSQDRPEPTTQYFAWLKALRRHPGLADLSTAERDFVRSLAYVLSTYGSLGIGCRPGSVRLRGDMQVGEKDMTRGLSRLVELGLFRISKMNAPGSARTYDIVPVLPVAQPDLVPAEPEPTAVEANPWADWEQQPASERAARTSPTRRRALDSR